MTTIIYQPGPADGYDTYVNEAHPNTNYETDQSLGVITPTPNRRMAFINFFLAGIPVGSIVISAKLSVYTGIVNSGKKLHLQKVVDAWYVNTLTWNNRPLPGTPPIIADADVNTWCEFNVKEIVQEWINNPLWNLGVQISAPLCDATESAMYSSDYVGDASKRPKLEVTYEPPAAGEQAARIYLATPGITIPSAVDTLVPLDAKLIGNDYIINLPGNMIYPVEPGYYLVTGKIGFTDIAGYCVVMAAIYKNGVRDDYGSSGFMGPYDRSLCVSLVYCDGVNDYIQLYAYHDNGVARTLVNSSFYTTLSVSKVGK
jgi:hypothetical protein